MLSEHYRTMGRFNAWANRQIYDAVAALPDADYRKDRPAAYFGSIHFRAPRFANAIVYIHSRIGRPSMRRMGRPSGAWAIRSCGMPSFV